MIITIYSIFLVFTLFIYILEIASFDNDLIDTISPLPVLANFHPNSAPKRVAKLKLDDITSLLNKKNHTLSSSLTTIICNTKNTILSIVRLKPVKKQETIIASEDTVNAKDQQLSQEPISNDYDTYYRERIEAATEYLQRQQFSLAINVLLQLIESNIRDIDANRLLGATLLYIEKPALAEVFLYNAVRNSNWTDFSSIANLAECLRQSDDNQLAKEIAVQGLELMKDHKESINEEAILRFTLGQIYESEGAYGLAAEWYLSAALLRPSAIEAWLKASTLQFPKDSIDLIFGMNVLIKAVSAVPNNSILLYNLGIILQMSHRYEDASILLNSAYSIDPIKFNITISSES